MSRLIGSSVGQKLRVGFGAVVVIVVILLVLIYIAADKTLDAVNRTKNLRVPTAAQSTGARAAMLEMLANIRGYLAVKDEGLKKNYEDARDRFEDHLKEMDLLAQNWTNADNKTRLKSLVSEFEAWGVLPQKMFDLTVDSEKNEPALRILANEGGPRIFTIIAAITAMIDEQAGIAATDDLSKTDKVLSMFKNMADFRGSFAGAGAGIRGYLATGDPKFRIEYDTAWATNQRAYDLVDGRKAELSADQVVQWAEIVKTRRDFESLPEQMFEAYDGDRRREDLYILKTQAAPGAAKVLGYLVDLTEDQQKLLDADVDLAATAQEDAQLQLIVGGLVAVVLAIFAALTLTRVITTPLRVIVEGIASGGDDLTKRLGVVSNDELGEVAKGFDKYTDNLHKIIQAINSTSSTLAGSAEELSAVSQQMSSNSEETTSQADAVSTAAEQVSRNVQVVATAVEEMTASIQEIARNATDASGVANEAVAVAATTNETVAKLGESSSEIGNVVKVISSIAEQTNLLALNATIEAARAGEAGKGFAVVANEVKELAKETATATEDIGRRIEAIQDDSRGAVVAIGQISEVIARIADIQNTIATSVEEQTITTAEIGTNVGEAARGIADISDNVASVAQAAQSTSEGAGQTQTAAQDLNQVAAELQSLVARFTI